jgi:ATP-dependent protease ClpP protease subunit
VKTPRDDLDRFYWYGINPRTRVLYLGGILEQDHGQDETMSEDPGIYWNTARRLVLGLSTLDDPKGAQPLTIIMNSCGGDWDHGMAIYDAITHCRSHVTIINMSHARSMTSIIFQAADLRITAPHGFYMIHDGFEGAWDIPKSVQNMVEYSKQHTGPTMYRIYLERLRAAEDQAAVARVLNSKLPQGARKVNARQGVNEDHMRQLCGQDTFFTPDEMVTLNFADRKLEAGDLAGAYANPDMHGLPTGQASLHDDEAEG